MRVNQPDNERIFEVDAHGYCGRPGNLIRLSVKGVVRVRQVGILLLDERGGLLEMGYARRAKAKNRWLYITARFAPSSQVLMIVDALDNDSYRAEERFLIKLPSGEVERVFRGRLSDR